MRILLASDFYHPFIGGAERQTQVLGEELARRGHHVQVATMWHEGQAEREAIGGLTVRRLRGLFTQVPWFSADPSRRYHPPAPDPAMVAGLSHHATDFRPDVVHATGWIAYSCAAAFARRHVPFVVSARDYGYTCPIRTLMRRGVECDGPAFGKCLDSARERYGLPKAMAAVGGVLGNRRLLQHSLAGVHAISQYVEMTVRRDLLTGAADERPTQTIVDIALPALLTDDYADADLAPGLPQGPFILFVGALQRHKGIYELLEAYQGLRGAPPLVLIGSAWPDTPAQFPAGVVVLRNLPHRQVMAAWDRCQFGVAPSLWPEPLGNVVFEAMARSKAVVATRTGGLVDLVQDGETGLLTPPGDAAALQAAMQRLLDNPGLRSRLGEAGRLVAARCTPDTVVPQFEAFYQRVLTHHGSARRGSPALVG